MIGIRATQGLDPFSVSEVLTSLIQTKAIRGDDTLFVASDDDVARVIQAWGKIAGIRVVPVGPEHAIADFINMQFNLVAKGEAVFFPNSGIPESEFACERCPES